MPIYEYQCGHCGHTFEKLQKHSEAPIMECPHCGELKVSKLLSAPSFRLSGQGWYETDFKKDNKRNLTDTPSGKAKDNDSKVHESGKKPHSGSTAHSTKSD